jgi:hypothetical protein
MWRTRITVVAFLVGVLVGTGSVEAFHMIRDRNHRQVFEEKIRCKGLAEVYVKSNSEDESFVLLERVDYSPARNSCIASALEVHEPGHGSSEHYRVVDLLSGETLYKGFCNNNSESGTTYCGNGRNVALANARDAAFASALKSPSTK